MNTTRTTNNLDISSHSKIRYGIFYQCVLLWHNKLRRLAITPVVMRLI